MNLSQRIGQHQTAVLSICIPTFNRAGSLNCLLRVLCDLKIQHGNRLEVCISNNNSTDDTKCVVERWAKLYDLKVVHQSYNIGSNANIRGVTALASGSWVMVIGDDDQIDQNVIGELLQFLEQLSDCSWVLARSYANGVSLPRRLDSGKVPPADMLRYIITHGLFEFGFIGIHIFKSCLVKDYLKLTPKQYQAWPHLTLFLTSIFVSNTCVFSKPVIYQGAAGVAYFAQGDWVITNISKLRVLKELRRSGAISIFAVLVLLMRELYSLRALKDIMLWKILEPIDFRKRSLKLFFGYYVSLFHLSIFLMPHMFFIMLLFLVPSSMLSSVLTLIGKPIDIAHYVKEKDLNKDNDMIRRGM